MKTEEDSRISPHFIPPPTRNGRALVDGEVSEDPLDVAAARFNLARPIVEQMFQDLDNAADKTDVFGLIGLLIERHKQPYRTAVEIYKIYDENMCSSDQVLRGSLSQAVAEAVRQRDAEWFLWLGKILRELDVYARKQSAKDFVQAAIVTMLFVCGFSDYANAKSFAEIARNELRRFRKTSGKATITKCAAHFLEKLKLAPMLTQRTQAARAEMTAARLEQISSKKAL